MGILNSLSLLSDPEESDGGLSRDELVRMARQNASRLQNALSALLDLAQLESGVFHARLREVDFEKSVRNRIEAVTKETRDLGVILSIEEKGGAPILADPQKLSRAVDLCLQAILPRAEASHPVTLTIENAELEFRFGLKRELRDAWAQAWTQAQVGYQGGVASPLSAFGGVLQSEQAFLTRQEEGLGSEFLLIHEIMRLHRGEFKMERSANAVILRLSFRRVSSEQDLRAILTSRAYDVSTELASVALVLMDVPRSARVEDFTTHLKTHLFRASDAVYPVVDQHRIALVLDDCKAEDVPKLLQRLETGLSGEFKPSKIGWAQCPGDGLDPGELVDLAQKRLKAH